MSDHEVTVDLDKDAEVTTVECTRIADDVRPQTMEVRRKFQYLCLPYSNKDVKLDYVETQHNDPDSATSDSQGTRIISLLPDPRQISPSHTGRVQNVSRNVNNIIDNISITNRSQNVKSHVKEIGSNINLENINIKKGLSQKGRGYSQKTFILKKPTVTDQISAENCSGAFIKSADELSVTQGRFRVRNHSQVVMDEGNTCVPNIQAPPYKPRPKMGKKNIKRLIKKTIEGSKNAMNGWLIRGSENLSQERPKSLLPTPNTQCIVSTDNLVVNKGSNVIAIDENLPNKAQKCYVTAIAKLYLYKNVIKNAKRQMTMLVN
jgi:hypothetical protein